MTLQQQTNTDYTNTKIKYLEKEMTYQKIIFEEHLAKKDQEIHLNERETAPKDPETPHGTDH